MKSRIVIRCDGNPSIGMGHVVRCMALANMLKNHFNIVIAIQQPDEELTNLLSENSSYIIALPHTNDYNLDLKNFISYLYPNDIVVLDGYNFDKSYQLTIKNKAAKLVFIDDINKGKQVADVIINQANGIKKEDYETEDYTQLYLGLKYVLLREPFLKKNTSREIIQLGKIFISMGAADEHNLSEKFVNALVTIKGIEEIHIMIGAVNHHLKSIENLIAKHPNVKIKPHININADELCQILNYCDLAICPASSILLESCAVGISLLSGFSADNQIDNLDGMEKSGVLINLGDLQKISKEEIQQKIEALIKEPQILNKLILNQKEIIDGKSPQRILKIFQDLSEDRLDFRFATQKDANLYYEWTNDSLVRLQSFNQNLVKYDDHINWFLSKLKSRDCLFYLFFDRKSEKPCGQIRIDKNQNEILIGISIAKEFRGQSLGTEMILKASEDYFQKFPDNIITAYIKAENKSSYRIFKKAGFEEQEILDVDGIKSYKLYKKRG